MNLEHKQSLQVKLTPELRQSLNLLQYSSIELKEFLYAEQIKNPLLEIKEAGDNDFFAGKIIELSFFIARGRDIWNLKLVHF